MPHHTFCCRTFDHAPCFIDRRRAAGFTLVELMIAVTIMAIVAGGIAGGFALLGGLILAHRRLVDPRIRRT